MKDIRNIPKRYEYCDMDLLLGKREGYSDYKKEFDSAYKFMAPKRPMYVVLEVNNYCNMRCKMCVKSMYESANGQDNIDLEILEKIIKDAEEVELPSIFLGGSTECTVNPHIKDIIKRIRNRKGCIDDVLITNGYLLDEELSNLLIDLQWEKVFVSLDAATQDTYYKIRGKNLDVVEQNLDNLIRLKEERQSDFPIIRVSFVIQDDNRKEIDEFIQKWEKKVQIIDFQDLLEYSDMSIKRNLPDTDEKCIAPFRQMMIDCRGNIYPCCTEWSKFMTIGNIKDMTIKEAWESDYIVKLRGSIVDGILNDICKSCLNSMNNN